MNNSVMFSSETDVWSTPISFFQALDKLFHFDLDVCALPENAKCKRYFTPEMDGLKQAWQGVCWMNPPYGKAIGQWVEKAYQAGLHGATVVCLIPARTDTRYWHDYCVNASEVYFVNDPALKDGACGCTRTVPCRHRAPR